MAIIFNRQSIPADGTILYKGTNLQRVIYNGVTVWQKYISSSGYVGSYYAQKEDAVPMVAASASPGDPSGYIYNRGAMSGNVLSWSGAGACVKANCDCTLTVSGTIRPHSSSGKKASKGWYYKNAAGIQEFFYVYTSDQTVNISKVVSLKAGETFSIQTASHNIAGGVVQFEIKATFSAVAV